MTLTHRASTEVFDVQCIPCSAPLPLLPLHSHKKAPTSSPTLTVTHGPLHHTLLSWAANAMQWAHLAKKRPRTEVLHRNLLALLELTLSWSSQMSPCNNFSMHRAYSRFRDSFVPLRYTSKRQEIRCYWRFSRATEMGQDNCKGLGSRVACKAGRSMLLRHSNLSATQQAGMHGVQGMYTAKKSFLQKQFNDNESLGIEERLQLTEPFLIHISECTKTTSPWA